MNDPAIAAVGGGRPALTGTAADVMSAGPRTCSRFSRVIEAVLIFKDEDCGMVPVVEEGRPVGVVTDRDIALALATYDDLIDRPIEEIMTTSLVTVPTTAPIADVIRTFGREAVRRLLVVDEDGLLVGVISWKDLCGEVTERAVGHVVTEVVDGPA